MAKSVHTSETSSETSENLKQKNHLKSPGQLQILPTNSGKSRKHWKTPKSPRKNSKVLEITEKAHPRKTQKNP